MTADTSPPAPSAALSADRLRHRGRRIAMLFVAFAAVMLGVGAWVLADTQSKERDQLQTRFANGAGVASAVLDGVFGTFRQQAVVLGQQFGGEVTSEGLDNYVEQRGTVFAAVLDASGAVLAASAEAPTQPNSDIFEEAQTSDFAISDLVMIDGQEVVETVVRFPISPDGKTVRYLFSASKAELFRSFLNGSIEPLVQYGGEAYILDGKGGILGAVSKSDPKQPPPPSRELIERVKTEEKGTYGSGDGERFFAGRPVVGTDWHVAVVVPTTELYEPASGVGRWLPWLILGFLGMALAAIGFLVRRAVDAGAQIAVINAQLEASQDRLRERAVELQASNAELQRSNAELEQFAYVASHDLSAPLRAVAGFSQLLGVRYKGKLDTDADQFITHMQDGVERMQRIIDDLLAYSRVDRSGLQPERIDLDAVLDEVLQSLRPDIEAREATVTRDPLGEACGEPGQLSQVLQNLIANALKFTAPGVRPTVHIAAKRAGERVRISVADNGIGVDPAQAEQIFKMFQRLHSTEDYEGTGIGLAIAKKIIDRHRGRIEIDRTPEGGAIFSFDIPAEMPR